MGRHLNMKHVQMILEKSADLIAVLFVVGFFVWKNNNDHPVLIRFGITISSVIMAAKLGPELANTVNGFEMISTIAVGAFGWAVLEVGLALIKDRKQIVELLRAWKGK